MDGPHLLTATPEVGTVVCFIPPDHADKTQTAHNRMVLDLSHQQVISLFEAEGGGVWIPTYARCDPQGDSRHGYQEVCTVRG